MKPDSVFIIAHKDAKCVFDATMKYWSAHGLPIHVVTVESDPISTSSNRILVKPPGFRHGKDSNDTMIDSWEKMLSVQWSMAAIFEYDSFCWKPELPEFEPGLNFNQYCNYEPYCNFPHVPIFVDKDSLSKMLDSVRGMVGVDGLWGDMLVGPAAIKAGVPMRPLGKMAYTALGCQVCNDNMDKMKKMIDDGMIMIHGTKTVGELRAIESLIK